jgi:hypothetical protein
MSKLVLNAMESMGKAIGVISKNIDETNSGMQR